MSWLSNLFNPGPAWKDTYEQIKALGSDLVQQLPIAAEHYEVFELGPKVHVVWCGRDVNGAIDRYNAEHGTRIDHNPKNHTFLWGIGPDDMQKGFSPRNKYVAFIVGDDDHWDRVGLGDEIGHLLMGERSHWLGE